MEVTYKQSVHGYAVIFNYDYVDDFAEPERRSLNPASINETGVSNPSKYLNAHMRKSVNISVFTCMKLTMTKMCPMTQHGRGQKDS